MTMLCILLESCLRCNITALIITRALLYNMRLEELKTELITLQNQKISLQERLEELENENKTYAEVKAGDSSLCSRYRTI